MAKKTLAVLVPGHGPSRDGTRLVEMSRVALEKGISLMEQLSADYLIVCTAYDTWRIDAGLKISLVERAGVDSAKVRVIPGVTDTYDEAEKTRKLIEELEIAVLVVVTDEWHALRSVPAFQARYPNVRILTETYTTSSFEQMMEPQFLKRIRGGNKALWIAWNLLLRFLMPTRS